MMPAGARVGPSCWPQYRLFPAARDAINQYAHVCAFPVRRHLDSAERWRFPVTQFTAIERFLAPGFCSSGPGVNGPEPVPRGSLLPQSTGFRRCVRWPEPSSLSPLTMRLAPGGIWRAATLLAQEVASLRDLTL